MSVTVTTNSLSPPAISNDPLCFSSCVVGSTVLVTAEGELDASNARGLTEHIDDALDGRRQLVVDLRELTFFGTAGFSALHHVNVRCAQRDVSWVVLPGRLVNRVLDICDHDRVLPVAPTLDSAVAAVSAAPKPLKSA